MTYYNILLYILKYMSLYLLKIKIGYNTFYITF